MRSLLAVLTLAVLVAACHDQPTALDETVAPQAKVAPSDREGWVEMVTWQYPEEANVLRNFPCLGDVQLVGNQTIYGKTTTTGWGGKNISIDHAYQPGFYVREVANGTKWYPTSTTQPGHFQFNRDGSSWRVATELLENYVSEDGTRRLKVRTHFSFDVAPEWDGTGDALPYILFETYQFKVPACVVN